MNGGRSWQRLRPAPGTSAVDFWTASAGVAAVTGRGGDRYYLTRDAGRHWQRLRPPGWSLDGGGVPASGGDMVQSSVCFASGGTGWAVADRHSRVSVLASADAGHRWQVVLSSRVLPYGGRDERDVSGYQPGDSVAVAGCSADAVWVVVTQWDKTGGAATDLLHTTNLGRSWLDVLRATGHPAPPAPAVPSPPGGPRALPVQILDVVTYLAAPGPDTAWLGLTTQMDGQDGFASTGNGGLTWRFWVLPESGIVPPLRPRATTLPPQTYICAMTALNASHAWLVLEGSPRAGVSWLYATGNGGATWRKISTFRTPEIPSR